ncbi:MAG: hypothetical protein QG670_2731 [Thermoproteota archaeon]|nr:hypothetical protein [Thermoproteota archaeon]
MIFITLWKCRQKATKEMLAVSVKLAERLPKEGINIIANYWTLGKCDLVTVAEAEDEKTFMKALLRYGDIFSTETLVALSREDALKLI